LHYAHHTAQCLIKLRYQVITDDFSFFIRASLAGDKEKPAAANRAMAEAAGWGEIRGVDQCCCHALPP